MEIRLFEISRRLVFRYYPVWMIISLLRYYRLKLIWGLDDESFYNMLFYGQGSVALYFIVMIVCLRVLKPRKGAFTWMTISLSVIIVVSLNLILKGVHFGSVVVPFSGSAIMTQTFISEVVAGVFVLWFYVIAERSLITEKRLLIERTKRLTDEKKLVENRLKLLQAQIEPQFLFNTLENIVQLREDSLDKAKSMQSHFIRYLRATLTKTRGKDTTIAQEMELIRAYLDIFKIRMGERLRYTLDIDPETQHITFPAMLIQPVVENAIAQGLEHTLNGWEILIRTQKQGKILRVEIKDTGSGSSEKETIGTRLLNVKERVHSLFDGLGKIFFEHNPPSGLSVIFEVPCG